MTEKQEEIQILETDPNDINMKIPGMKITISNMFNIF
jgi:hypothetical protein